MAKHFTAADVEQLGFFEKENRKLGRYQTVCKNGKRGFLGELHAAHHILPATAFKESIAKLSVEKQAYVANCKHVTPWNINNADNLIGLPDIKAFVAVAENSATIAESEALVKPGEKAQFNARSPAKREKRLKALRRKPPYGHAVHLPTSWGHHLYNAAVASDLGTQIWATLDEAKEEHKVSPEAFAEALKKLETKYFKHLQNRGSSATLQNWNLRHVVLREDASPASRAAVSTWYKSFTMHPGAKPLA